MTDFLQFTANKFDFYKTIVPVLKKGVDASVSTQIIDLASGGGGGWKSLSKHLKQEMPNVTVRFTDYYPNIKAFEEMEKLDSDTGLPSKNVTNFLKPLFY